MQKIKIIADATCDLTQEEVEKFDIDFVYPIINIDSVEYTKIDNEEYLYMMREAKKFSTSQPSVGAFMEIYEKWTNLGYTIISIHVSSALSGTFNTACSVAKEFDNVYVIDSMSASRGMAYFIQEAYYRIQNNEPIEKIVKCLEEKQSKVLTYLTVDKLDNLVKGGRLRKSAGILGHLLNIKILIKLFSESLEVVDKVRGNKKLLLALINQMKADLHGQKIKEIRVIHTLAMDHVDKVIQQIEEHFHFKINREEAMITTPVIATHTGEGAVAILVEVE